MHYVGRFYVFNQKTWWSLMKPTCDTAMEVGTQTHAFVMAGGTQCFEAGGTPSRENWTLWMSSKTKQGNPVYHWIDWSHQGIEQVEPVNHLIGVNATKFLIETILDTISRSLQPPIDKGDKRVKPSASKGKQKVKCGLPSRDVRPVFFNPHLTTC